MPKTKLAVVVTHPIQYFSPIFRALAAGEALQPRVFYTWSQVQASAIPDRGFGKHIVWDIPLLEGYDHEFVHNSAQRPGPEHFRGIQNPGLNQAIIDWGADALMVFGWNLHSHLGAMRFFKGRLPVFFRGDSTLLDRRSPARALLRKHLLRWVYRHVDVALAVGQNNRDYFTHHGVKPEQAPILPHAIDVRRFGAPEAALGERSGGWREALGVGPEETVFLFAGKLQPKKDPQLLLEAFLQMRTPARLVLCGDGELEGALRERAQASPRVHFIPFQNQRAMPALYRLGDVFVLPSRGPEETWGLALNEAMASGRPIIASSRVGGARDLVTDGVGWGFPAQQLPALLEVMESAARAGRTRLRQMGEAAQAASHAWSAEAIAQQLGRLVLPVTRDYLPRRGPRAA